MAETPAGRGAVWNHQMFLQEGSPETNHFFGACDSTDSREAILEGGRSLLQTWAAAQALWLWAPASISTTNVGALLVRFILLGCSHLVFIGEAPPPPVYYNLTVKMGKSGALEGTDCAHGHTELR